MGSVLIIPSRREVLFNLMDFTELNSSSSFVETAQDLSDIRAGVQTAHFVSKQNMAVWHRRWRLDDAATNEGKLNFTSAKYSYPTK